jgi:superfamily II DNA or RNA helicase
MTDDGLPDEALAEQIKLRPYQTDAIARINEAIGRGVRRIMVQLATGAGKTHIASSMTAGQDKPMIFTVPAIELVDQTLEKFHREGIRDVGVMQAAHRLTDSSRPIQIASVQTLMRREIPPAELVFIDEAHTVFTFYGKWFTDPARKDVPFIGLSATPWARGLGRLYQELIIAATTRDLIDLGYLSKFRVFAPAHPDLKGVRTLAGDYRFASGEYAVVCNVGVLTMGVDWDVRCIVLARPTKSEMLFVQIIGRGLRPAADKDYCLILDHSDTTSRLGFVTDIHHDELDDGDRRPSTARTGSSFLKNVRCVPACGRRQPMSAPTAASRPRPSTKCTCSMVSCANSTATSAASSIPLRSMACSNTSATLAVTRRVGLFISQRNISAIAQPALMRHRRASHHVKFCVGRKADASPMRRGGRAA